MQPRIIPAETPSAAIRDKTGKGLECGERESERPKREPNEAYGKSIPDILAIIKDSYSELRPAERRVADVVLADVTFAVDASNGDIAKRSETSEPTVTRFCRAIGCEGVRDFKLKLAQSTVVGRLYLDVPKERRPSADRSPLWKEVFGEARAALAVVEEHAFSR